jgi:hypothetical protein
MGVDGLDSPSCVKGISGLSLLLPNYLRFIQKLYQKQQNRSKPESVNHNKNKEVRGPHRWDTDGLFAFSS